MKKYKVEYLFFNGIPIREEDLDTAYEIMVARNEKDYIKADFLRKKLEDFYYGVRCEKDKIILHAPFCLSEVAITLIT